MIVESCGGLTNTNPQAQLKTQRANEKKISQINQEDEADYCLSST